jgi:hypothetical protein
VTHRIQYTPGPDGVDSFLKTLQSIGIKVASASQVTFLCRCPDTGEEVSLRGLKAFDAAAYCASITAAKRLMRGGGGGASGEGGGEGGSAPERARRVSEGDMGVHAAHPDSPTAAGAAARRLFCGPGAAVDPSGASTSSSSSSGSSDAAGGAERVAPPRAAAPAAAGGGRVGRFWGHAAALLLGRRGSH